jgi:hypothetical protein
MSVALPMTASRYSLRRFSTAILRVVAFYLVAHVLDFLQRRFSVESRCEPALARLYTDCGLPQTTLWPLDPGEAP